MGSPVARIVGEVSRKYGIAFFEQLLIQLNGTTNCHFSFIAKFDDREQQAILPILACISGKDKTALSETHFTAKVREQITGGHAIHLPNNATSIFANLADIELHTNQAISTEDYYIIVPLFGSSDQVIGVIAILGRAENSELDNNKALLQLFSGRVGAEIERFEYDQALRQENKALDEDHQQKLAQLARASQDLEKARSKLVEAEKMAALGDLVAGVAHEVNTPLGVAITAGSFLTESFDNFKAKLDDGKLSMTDMTNFVGIFEQSVPMITKNLHRSKEIIDNFKKMASDQMQLTAENIALSAYYQRLITTLTPLFKRKKVQVNFAGCDKDVLNTYPGCHAQLITNLVTNSIQHGFDDQGNDNQISITLAHANNGEFVVDYKDNGVGISNEIAERILEPFFTTSRFKGNTGLGLPIVYNLVTANLAGKFECIPSENGAHFRYHFSSVAND